MAIDGSSGAGNFFEKTSFTTEEAEAIDELTAASAQSVRLVVTFTKGRGTLRYWKVSCGPCYQLMSKPSNVLILS